MEDGATKRAAVQLDQDQLISRSRYRRMFLVGVLTVSAVALVPLAIMAVMSYRQYRQAFRSEMTRPMLRFAEAGKQSLESYLAERISALARVARESSYDTLQDSRRLDVILSDMKAMGDGIVDLGVVRDDGVQVSYAGPYALTGRNYADQTWFREVATRGSYVSDVFMGHRNLPHIVIAIQSDRGGGRWFALRATVDTDVFHWLVRDRGSRRPEQGSVCHRCHSLGVPAFSDAFIINREGVLQTPSRLYGAVLERAPIPPLPTAREARFIELADSSGVPLAAAFADIDRSPFTLVLLAPRDALHAGWRPLRRDLVLFPLISGLIILGVIIGGSLYVVNRAREADHKRAALFHKMEYTNKLAAIGRLGAGVAHEINNPLSIITQKAGLLHDLLTMSDELPPKSKILELVESVQRSAERCGGITHRLLGFAKHMDVERETINLEALLREVLGFLDKEANYRSIHVELAADDDVPPIISDRGQLQQVFLNIVNNAFAAVDDGGRIEIGIRRQGDTGVAVTIADNGVGIPAEHLKQIFDPFFTTKKGAGTGLGLSITYGIVQKLGGEIGVSSDVGVGTRFTVTLPVGGDRG
ncbi:MAG: ATP-binding protein [Gemmatimonadota bacterium]|jgi:two-component system NtrC family sensor kinase